MLVVFEPVCFGLEHAPFNSGLLAAALELSAKVVFAADPSHIAAVRDYASPSMRSAVEWHPLEIPPRRLEAFGARFRLERKLLREVWKIVASQSAQAVISTGITVPGLLAMKWQLWSRPSSPAVGVVFHSVLGKFLYSEKRRLFFRTARPHALHYIFLGDAIRAEVLKLVPQIRAWSYSVPHPLATSIEPCEPGLPARAIFAFLGAASERKGFPAFMQLVRDLPSGSVNGPLFEVIGRCPPEFQAQAAALVASCPDKFRLSAFTGQMLEPEVYRNRLMAATYAIMPYAPDTYRFTCSGAALDAISAAKPIIAFRNPMTEELFSKLGDIGYLCTDYPHLLRTVREIVESPVPGRYRQQCENLVRGRDLFGTHALAAHLGVALGLRRA